MTEISQETKDLLERFYKMQTKKKESYARTKKSAFGGKSMGQIFGFALAPPFSINDVEKFEKDNNLRFPEDFRHYIITFTSEIFTTCYPHIVTLEKADIDLAHSDCTVADNIHCFGWEVTNKEYEDFCKCSLKIGDSGCAYFDVILIKGNRKGSIWEFCDPEYYLSATSFTHLVTYQLSQFEYNNFGAVKDRSPLAAESYAKTHNEPQEPPLIVTSDFVANWDN